MDNAKTTRVVCICAALTLITAVICATKGCEIAYGRDAALAEQGYTWITKNSRGWEKNE